jgi:autotransporter-associated beta strand protein
MTGQLRPADVGEGDVPGSSRGVALIGAGVGTFSGTITNQPTNPAIGINLTKLGSGTWTLSASNAYNGTTTVSDGTLTLAHVNALGASTLLTIDTTGHGRLAPGLTSAVKVPALVVNGASASLDMTDNDLIVSSTTPTSTIVGYLTTGRNGGTWDGSGIASSTAQNNPQHNTGLGVLTGAEYDTFGGGGIFNGTSYVPTDTLIKYTWNGDANFSGTVNFDDYVRVDVGFNTGLTGWSNGDFNYSGAVNFDDYVLIDVAFNTQSGTLGRAIDYLSGDDRGSEGLDSPAMRKVVEHFDQFGLPYAQAFLAAVPEPALRGIVGLVGACLACRRRRVSTITRIDR